MKFSENWLRAWVNPKLSSTELGHLLTMAGLEVEDLAPVAPAFNNVVVAEVMEVVKHPDADRLNVCQVKVGADEILNIVCGAANVAVGIKVPCARIGAVLPGDFKIKQAKVRGIESFGMLCSDKELGLAAESSGLWLLPEDAPVGTSIREYLDLDDCVYTLKLTPNRSDCSGLSGIAREVAALTGSELSVPEVPVTKVSCDAQIAVTVEDKLACPRYCGRIIKGVNAAAATPDWMRRRLERSGLRCINAVVDITNYVMMELGQPMHAFDLATLSGGISVRRAVKGEALTLLNDQLVELSDDVLVIADQKRALALAGIMGGAGCGVETATTDVLLEAAFFDPDAIAGRARRYGLATDSSFRFERGVDFASTRHAIERASQLLIEICGGAAGEITEVAGQMPRRAPIALRKSRVARVLGIALELEQIAGIIARLQFEFTVDGECFCVTPPSFRFDLAIEADLIEEIARVHGYDNIPATSPKAALTMLPHSETQRPLARILQTLVARDYQEIVSYAFVEERIERELCGNENPVRLQNPIASNLAVMRSSLIGNLVEALHFNLNRRQTRVRLFEVGATFSGADGGYRQTQRLSGIAYGAKLPEQWGAASTAVDFYDVKADLEALFSPRELRFVAAVHPALHPGRSAEVCCDGRRIGWIGELHPKFQGDMAQSCIWFEVELDALLCAFVPVMSEIPKFLPVRRDLAIVADEAVAAQTLIDAMQNARAPFVQEVVLFDVYRGKGVEAGKKSLAFRVLLQDTQKTLTDAEIESGIAVLVEVLNREGAQLRM